MSVIFPPAILGPEMAAPILWAPGNFGLFLLESPHAHKIAPFRRGFWAFLLKGGVEVPIEFMGAGIFLKNGVSGFRGSLAGWGDCNKDKSFHSHICVGIVQKPGNKILHLYCSIFHKLFKLHCGTAVRLET